MVQKIYFYLILLFLTSFFLPNILWAQSAQEKKILKELKKKNKKAPKIVPPNGLWLRDNLFIDKTEVAVVHWQEYIHYLQKDSSAAYAAKQMPDTTVFNRVCHVAPLDPEECLAMIFFYSDPTFRFAPIIGITYAQAQAYCQWRSKSATETFRKNNPKSKVTFSYRLPSEKEWEEAAQMAYSLPAYPHGYAATHTAPEKTDLKALKKMYQMSDETEKELAQKLEIFYQKGKQTAFNVNDPFYGVPFLPRHALEWIYQRQPIKCEFLPFQMIGNAAEMVAEKNISKGGSWLNSVQESAIKSRFYYAQQECWLGFRCICEIGEEK